MKTHFPFLILFLTCFTLQAQHAVSGYLNLKEQFSNQEVVLFLVNSATDMESDSGNFIANTPIDEDGYFAFNKNLFDDQNRIYKIQINGIANTIKDASKLKSFILSKKDSVFFRRGNELFGKHTGTNAFDRRWLKLKHMEEQYQHYLDQNSRQQYKEYLRDSLEILLVKLISIKELNDKNLLETDLKANQAYYVALLEEFKASDLDPIEYAYLESKCALVAKDLIHRKYQMSMTFNALAFLVISGLLFFLFKFIKTSRQLPVANLSKQESTIKNLILEGKSNKEIANELFVSISTVKTHITNIYSKLGVANRKELLSYQ